jgi:hypothetical protein
MTLAEYSAKSRGFSEHEIEMRQYSAWLTGITAGAAVGASKENPYFTFDEFRRQLSGEEKQEESDEELFKIAQEKGIEIPPGVLEEIE